MQIKRHFNTFSEAIREGAKLRPQGDGAFLYNGRTCALGAGAEAMGFDEATLLRGCFVSVALVYPYLANAVTCPVCSEGSDIGGVIVDLNDHHGWTREAIADWLESEEEKLGYITLTTEPETTNSLRTQDQFSLVGG